MTRNIVVETVQTFEVRFERESKSEYLKEDIIHLDTLSLAEALYASSLAQFFINGTAEYNYVSLVLVKISHYSNGSKTEELLASHRTGYPLSEQSY